MVKYYHPCMRCLGHGELLSNWNTICTHSFTIQVDVIDLAAKDFMSSIFISYLVYQRLWQMPTFFSKLRNHLQNIFMCLGLCLELLFSLQGPILHHAKKLIGEASSEEKLLNLKCSSVEDKMQMLHMQLEASEKFKTEYQKLYEDAINDLNKVSECYKSCITDLARKCSSLDERYSCSLEMLDSAKQESLEWRRKYPNEEEARLADARGKGPMNGKRSMILQLMNSRLI